MERNPGVPSSSPTPAMLCHVPCLACIGEVEVSGCEGCEEGAEPSCSPRGVLAPRWRLVHPGVSTNRDRPQAVAAHPFYRVSLRKVFWSFLVRGFANRMSRSDGQGVVWSRPMRPWPNPPTTSCILPRSVGLGCSWLDLHAWNPTLNLWLGVRWKGETGVRY